MAVEISIENIGGIRTARASVEPGLNVVSGANWQGKTSFVHGIEAALGLPVTVTEGTDEGTVTLRGEEIRATVEVLETNGRTVVEGSSLLATESAKTKAELYACLGESNPIRKTVRGGENLETVLTRPLDLENIDQKIGELKSERDRIDTEISKAENSKNAIPQVKERIERLESQIEQYESQLDALEQGDEGGTDKREALSQARSERNRVQSEVDRLERSIDRYTGKIEEYESELESITVEDIDVDYQDIEAKKAELDEIRSDIKVLETLFTANNLILEENSLELISSVDHGVDTDSFACWICGEETTRAVVEKNVQELQETLQVHRSKLTETKSELNEMETKYEQQQQQKNRQQVLEEDIQELERELEEKTERLEERKESIVELEGRIETLRDAVDESVEEITDIESELKFRESELEEARDELEKHQRSAYQLDQLQERRSSIAAELNELRDRKTTVKQDMRDTFHETMQDIVAGFETGFESARLTANFDLVVARDGRETDLGALSEGEREILGFIAALAGYEAFAVAETVPFLLLDGLEALSDENLHNLVRYFEERAEYLIVTAHPEHSEFSGNSIDPAAWDTVTGDPIPEQVQS